MNSLIRTNHVFTKHFGVWGLGRPNLRILHSPNISRSLYSLRFILGFLVSISAFLALALTEDDGGRQNPQQQTSEMLVTHSAAWSVLFSWSLVLLQMADCPCFGVYIYILQNVLQDIVAFFISTSALMLGFSFAFHLILQSSELFRNPITSVIAALSMVVGHYGNNEVMTSTSTPGTSEVMFLAFYFVFSIGTYH